MCAFRRTVTVRIGLDHRADGYARSDMPLDNSEVVSQVLQRHLGPGGRVAVRFKISAVATQCDYSGHPASHEVTPVLLPTLRRPSTYSPPRTKFTVTWVSTSTGSPLST